VIQVRVAERVKTLKSERAASDLKRATLLVVRPW
jgi:hypothetical protein